MPQSDWLWCQNCQGLFFGGTATSVCPAGNGHDGSTSGNYTLDTEPADPGQHNWRWCQKCQGLFFGDSPGLCAAGGEHDGSVSGDYSLRTDLPAPTGERGWRWCHRCGGLFYSQNTTTGWCPRGGGHDYGPSSDYTLRRVARVTDAVATNELPGGGGRRFLLSVQGAGVTPGRAAETKVVVAGVGRRIAAGRVTATRTGELSWAVEVHNVNCGEELVATVRDEATGVESDAFAFSAMCPEVP